MFVPKLSSVITSLPSFVPRVYISFQEGAYNLLIWVCVIMSRKYSCVFNVFYVSPGLSKIKTCSVLAVVAFTDIKALTSAITNVCATRWKHFSLLWVETAHSPYEYISFCFNLTGTLLITDGLFSANLVSRNVLTPKIRRASWMWGLAG